MSKMVRAGRLRHRITWEQPAPPDHDSDGALVENWLPLFDRPMPAEIVALSGRELIAAQSMQSKVSTRIKVRYRVEYAANCRGLHRGVIYNIQAVIPDLDSGIRYLSLSCTSGTNEG